MPVELREQLAGEFSLEQPRSLEHVISESGDTRKDLLELADGEQIESVLLRYRLRGRQDGDRYSVCVSTQVGCACGCQFCATGAMGFVRQLSAVEIIAQVVHARRVLAQPDGPGAAALSNVVLMGMGEPLLNYEATLDAVHRMTDPRALGIAPRRITLSTVGIAPAIERLAQEHLPIKLAVSLHAATNPLRSRLLPINARYPLERLRAALHTYTQETGKRVFLEWLLLRDINDTPEQARALVAWLGELPAHVNLIRPNPTATFTTRPATEEEIRAFTAVLDHHHIPHTVRQRRGAKIAAGCGQLRARRRHCQETDQTDARSL